MRSLPTTKDAGRGRTSSAGSALSRPADGTPEPMLASGSGALDCEQNRTATRAAAIAAGLRRTGAARSQRPAPRQLRRAVPLDDQLVRDAEESLARRIRAHLASGGLTVALTDNRYTMISVRRDASGPHYRVRLHHMFADAEPVITRALANYVGENCPDASRLLGEYIDANQDRVRPATRRVAGRSVVTKGDVHDLESIFDQINERYFDNAIDATITWGPRCGRPRRRNSIKMGSYSVEDKLIRLHRSLDREIVPRYFVGWIVYHEMLHQVHGAPLVNGRRQFHTKAFLEDESRYEQYHASRTWERENIETLLTY